LTAEANAKTELHAAAARMLDREVSALSLREATVSVAFRKDLIERGTKSVVVFRIGAEWLALPTGVVQEVSEPCTVRVLPDRRGGMLSGVANVRGDLLLCVELRVLLGLEPAAGGSVGRSSSERLLICKHSQGRLAFRVSEVHGLHRYRPADMRAAPATLVRAAGNVYTLGVLPWQERIVGCLDDELMFYAINKGLA
jgi:chemotaxis-related protein WspD